MVILKGSLLRNSEITVLSSDHAQAFSAARSHVPVLSSKQPSTTQLLRLFPYVFLTPDYYFLFIGFFISLLFVDLCHGDWLWSLNPAAPLVWLGSRLHAQLHSELRRGKQIWCLMSLAASWPEEMQQLGWDQHNRHSTPWDHR